MNGTLHLVKHPLIEHKMTMLRDRTTNSNTFRTLVQELTRLVMIPATQQLQLEKRTIDTPLVQTIGHHLAESILVIPILRAGLGMLDAFTEMIPVAKVGHIGLARNEKTFAVETYIAKLPKVDRYTQVFILDPMLATGGTLIKAIDMVKAKGAKKIIHLGLVGVQSGVDRVLNAHPDVHIYLASLDKKLDDHGYIIPGLGDAGDRLFGAEDQ
jgi:uracil phosphoribosyltransferase